MSAIYIEKSDIGATLTTWVYCSAWQLYALEQENLRGYINWPHEKLRALRPYWDDNQFKNNSNMHDWYFEQPHCHIIPTRETVWQWEIPNPLYDLGKHSLYGLPIQEIKKFYKKNVRLNQHVCQRGEALQKKYGIDFANTIGITWRGTDSVIDGRPRMPIETYFPFIDDILKSHPNPPSLRIMATAEEDILGPLLARYPQAFKIEEFETSPAGRRTLGDNPERFSKLSGFERGMQPALMVWLFSQCAYYIKNRSSTGAVASWLSDGHIVCLAHPENLGHGFDITKAEINGQLVPLNR